MKLIFQTDPVIGLGIAAIHLKFNLIKQTIKINKLTRGYSLRCTGLKLVTKGYKGYKFFD